MRVIIQPSPVTGNITAPASKSAMQRACALALLHTGETTIHNPGISNDDLAAIGIIERLGAQIFKNAPGEIQVKSLGLHAPGNKIINCGESGLSIRMFAPIAALSSCEITITGEGSLLNRPMDFFDAIFPQLGVAITSGNGKLPIQVRGPLQPKDISIDGSLSSQFLTGLLIAFAKTAKEQVTITVSDLKSRPYIDLTLQMLQHFGYIVEHEHYERFIIKPGPEKLNSISYTVEGDWSGGAFLLVTGAIAGEITVGGLDVYSAQADKAVLHALMMTGCRLSITETQIVIAPPVAGSLKAFHFNATDCPDLFPPLVALAAYCEGNSVIEGVSRLLHKESNRALALQEEFGKMGVPIELQDDLMIIHGGNGVKGAEVHSHHDHRIAMACSVTALKADGVVTIDDAQAVNKSYPGFYDNLKLLGAAVSLP